MGTEFIFIKKMVCFNLPEVLWWLFGKG